MPSFETAWNTCGSQRWQSSCLLVACQHVSLRAQDPAAKPASSRGNILKDWLSSSDSAAAFIAKLSESDTSFGPYNVVFIDANACSAVYHSNRGQQRTQQLSPGLTAVSNGELNDVWPKMRRGKARLSPILSHLAGASAGTSEPPAIPWQEMFAVMCDTEQARGEELEHTGWPPHIEQRLSSMFVQDMDVGPVQLLACAS